MKAFSEKLSKLEKDYALSKSTVKKLILDTQMLNEILNNNKAFGDKQGLGFEEGVSKPSSTASKFIKPGAIDPYNLI